MNNEFKKTSSKHQTVYTLESATAGGTSSSSIASTDGNNLIAQESDKKKIPSSTPRNFVAKNAKSSGAGAHKDKKKAEKQGSVKHKKPFMEGFNGEYDDEAGMAQSNLLTTARAVMGLLKTIKDRDNLPEWGQEKIAKAEMMLVSVWDYLQSQKAMGNDPQQGVAEAFQNDESNLFYIYDKSSGRLKQRMIQNLDEPKARSAGYRDSVDDALKHAGIIRSKFDPKKFIQNQGGKWIQVFPFGEQDVAEVFGKDKETGTTHKGGVVTKTTQGTKHTKTDYDDGNGEKGRKPSGEGPASRYTQTPILDKDDDMDEGAMSDLDADRKEKQYKGTQAYHAKKKADKEKSSADAKKEFYNKFGGGNPANNLKIREHDQYSESLDQMLERQLEPTMDLDAWNDNFQNADPQKYHQFKNKSPEKKK